MEPISRKVVALDDVRADGWFEQLGEDLPELDQLCQVIGRRFVAFSFITGVRISSVAYDPHSPHSSLVDFTLSGSEDVQRLALADLRERLGAALLAAESDEPELPLQPSSDDIRRYIGRRYLLLAPLFGLGLEALEVGGEQEPMLRLKLGASTEAISVQGLRDVIHNAIRSELARSRPNQPFSIDFKRVPAAEAANSRGDYEETVSLLGSWPGPLSMFLRTPQGQALGDGERSKLVRALCALGEAYLRKRQAEWAEDVLRLGIQFGQELPASAPAFALLGRARVESGRYGEAIGLLKRALALGADKAEVLPDLARCFVERKRYVAAMALLDDAMEAGVSPESLEELRQTVAQALGPAYDHYRELAEGEGGGS
ncbi:MAG: tetratricopeptide repeat protein [Polyangiales bacterium]